MNKKYDVEFHPKYIFNESQKSKSFDKEEDLVAFLEEMGYDTTEEEIFDLIQNGGEHKGLVDTEFTVKVEEVEEQKDSEPEPEPEKEEGEEGEEKEEDEKEEGEKEEGEKEEEEKEEEEEEDDVPEIEEQTDEDVEAAEAFIEEYEDYLVGKNLNFIADPNDEDYNEEEKIFVDRITSVVLGDAGHVVIKTKNENDFLLPNLMFQDFIDGNELELDEFTGTVHLVIQEEKQPEPPQEIIPLNNPGFKYYVVDPESKKILGGFEYSDEAADHQKEFISFGRPNIIVVKQKQLADHEIDPNNNDNWDLGSHDKIIIEESFAGMGADEIKKYIDGFSASGKYLSVVKNKLITYFNKNHKDFIAAINDSNIEKVNAIKPIMERTEKELMKILLMEK